MRVAVGLAPDIVLSSVPHVDSTYTLVMPIKLMT